ncbi:MAG: YfjI family protein, partial [Pseudomonadota bacterium]
MLDLNTQPQGIDWKDFSAFEGLAAVSKAIDGAEPVEPPPEPPKWPEPMLPGTLRTPDFPNDILQGVWGDMARAVSESTQTPPALSIMCLLGVLATLLQRRFEVRPYGLDDSYSEPLSLWCISASPSGTRKTSVLSAFMAPIVSWERLQYDRFRVIVARANAARSTAKKRIEALNQQSAKCKDDAELKTLRDSIEREELDMPDEVIPPRLFTGDTTAERLQAMLFENAERMAVHSDEPGIFRIMAGAYSNGSQNIDVFLQGHAGSAMRIDRAGRIAHVDKPALSFNLMVQPGMLSEVAGSKGFRDSGLLARFMYAVPASNVGQRDVRKHTSIAASVRKAYEQGVYSLLNGWLCEPGKVPDVQVMDLCDHAKELWLDFSQYIEDNHGDEGQFESIRDWTSKLAGAVARIAALLELAEMGLGAETVSYSAMERAIKLAKLLIPHAQAAFGLLGADSTEGDALAVVKWVQSNGFGVFTRRDAQKAMEGRFRSVEKLKRALERLEAMDCVQEFKRSNKGTKSTVCYR